MEPNKDGPKNPKQPISSSANAQELRKTFSQVVEGKRFSFPKDAKFEATLHHEDETNLVPAQGEVHYSKCITIKPNDSMLSAISSEISRLRDSTIFFAAFDVNNLPSRQ